MTLVRDEELRGAMVLVTRADSFIESHLVDLCVEAGADVQAFVGRPRVACSTTSSISVIG